jgi:signal peptidase II
VTSKWRWSLLVAGGVLAMDTLTKWWVRQVIALGHSEPLVGDWVRLTYVLNPGAAFGLHLGPYSRSILTTLALVALVVIWVALDSTHEHDRFRMVALALVGGGAAGNLLDRVGQGAVVDFLDIGFGRLRWPVFNVADVGVTLGALLLVLLLIDEAEAQRRERDQS